MTLVIMLIIMVGTIVFGIPVAFGICLSSLYAIIANGLPYSTFIQNFSLGVNSFTLLAIPFFILAGKLMNTSGITDRIFKFISYLVGPVHGGLAQVNILSSLVFAGMSGSATADAAGLGMIEIKAMKDAGYDADFTVAVTAASSTVGPIIPPSIIMVIYGISAEVSVGKLFLGGIAPGVLMTIGLMVLSYFIALKRDYPREKRVATSVLLKTFWKALPSLLAPVIIISGILSGVFTATEAGGVIVLYAFILGVLVYREITFKQLYTVTLETMVTTASILVIIGAAKVFGWILTYYNIPAMVAEQLLSLSSDKIVIGLLLVLLYLLLGCIMEAAAIVVMTIPVVIPVLNQVGIDPIAFGVIVAVCMSIGTLTPPLGIVMYVLCNLGNISVWSYIKALFPFLLVLIGIIIILTIFPEIIMYIPNNFG